MLSQISHNIIGIYLAMSEATYRLRNAIFRTFPLLDANEQAEIVELKR